MSLNKVFISVVVYIRAGMNAISWVQLFVLH